MHVWAELSCARVERVWGLMTPQGPIQSQTLTHCSSAPQADKDIRTSHTSVALWSSFWFLTPSPLCDSGSRTKPEKVTLALPCRNTLPPQISLHKKRRGGFPSPATLRHSWSQQQPVTTGFQGTPNNSYPEKNTSWLTSFPPKCWDSKTAAQFPGS